VLAVGQASEGEVPAAGLVSPQSEQRGGRLDGEGAALPPCDMHRKVSHEAGRGGARGLLGEPLTGLRRCGDSVHFSALDWRMSWDSWQTQLDCVAVCVHCIGLPKANQCGFLGACYRDEPEQMRHATAICAMCTGDAVP